MSTAERSAHSSRVLQPHGTPAALRRHERAHEEPCEPCKVVRRELNSAKVARYRARQRASKNPPNVG